MSPFTVQARDLTVQYGDFKAVDRVSFAVTGGEIFGFLGANGAGKTTTIRVLCGILQPTSGEASIAGHLVSAATANTIKTKVGYMSQKFTLYNDMSVGENLEFTAGIRKLDQSTFERRRKELFKFISFDRPLNTMVKDLPGGIKQQVSLAASLLHDPEIVFLDEPTAGVTSALRAKFWNLIKQLSKDGKTIFVTSHYMDEVEQCDRIALMRAGQLIALNTPEGLKESTFPDPLYQLSPRTPLNLLELTASPHLESFNPHGLRFHATPKSQSSWKAFVAKEGFRFIIQAIRPSLEDVFIRLVEGKNR